MRGKRFLIESKDQESFGYLKEQEWSYLLEVFSEIEPWSELFHLPERITWVQAEGIPLHCWNQTTFIRISEVWGKLIAMGENASQCLDGDKVTLLISTNQRHNLDGVLELEAGRECFLIRIKELGFNIHSSFKSNEGREAYISGCSTIKINGVVKSKHENNPEEGLVIEEKVSGKKEGLVENANLNGLLGINNCKLGALEDTSLPVNTIIDQAREDSLLMGFQNIELKQQNFVEEDSDMDIFGEQIMEQHLEKASWAERVDSLNSLEPRDNYIMANTEPNSFNLFSSSGTITKRRFQFQFISRRNGYQGEWKAQPKFCGLVLRSHFFEKGCGGALCTDGGLLE
ncbi:hypothetical protein V6N13_001636 [Hibiscus sabdariffa]